MKWISFLLFPLLLLVCTDTYATDIILDPGHSPSRPGTQSCSGGHEYRYNEDLVRTIRSHLVRRGITVDVTKEDGAEISLHARARKSAGKQFFLSVHHDSAQEKYIRRVNGHPCSDSVHGFSIFVSRKNVDYETSRRFAYMLGTQLVDMGLQPSTHHKEPIRGENRPCLSERYGVYEFDDLIVLKEARCPAVLLEAAVIIHPGDDAAARSREYQEKIARAVETAIRQYRLPESVSPQN